MSGWYYINFTYRRPKSKEIIKDRDGHIVIKMSVHQDGMAIQNRYAPDKRAANKMWNKNWKN